MKPSSDAHTVDGSSAAPQQTPPASVALLTPYDGGNLGDAAIQEALIQNLRRINPQVQLCGITLYPEKTSAAHHIPCFPLAANSLPFYYSRKKPWPATDESAQSPSAAAPAMRPRLFHKLIRLPGMSFFRKLGKALLGLNREIRHVGRSYALLRHIDLLLIAGGGQLDEEWGGSWGHPFALMKWTVLARMAGSSVAFLSVGGCFTESRLTKFFLRIALSMACYRSYRDIGSQELALNMNPHAKGPVVPDLAFSLPSASFPPEVRREFRVGVSPIAYAHAGLWPKRDPEKYKQYMTQLGAFVTSLLRRRILVTFFSSATPDEQIFQELRACLDPGLDEAELHRLTISSFESLSDLLVLLQSCDLVVASRLHGLILSFLLGKPSLAISYDRKVQCLMNDLDQAAYCIDIRSVRSDDLLAMFSSLQQNAQLIPSGLRIIRENYSQLLKIQYQTVAQIMCGGLRKRQKIHAPVSAEDRQSKDAPEVRRVS